VNILIINGPNLNLLGTREPEVYGHETLDDINKKLAEHGKMLGCALECFQSNAEHEIINQIHLAKSKEVAYIIINPGAFTHTSIAIRDALLGIAIPFIEIHLSNVHSREDFRQISYLSDIAVGCITGLGSIGYTLALDAAVHNLNSGD
jgi:3-dehydroquinate dehydratase-2